MKDLRIIEGTVMKSEKYGFVLREDVAVTGHDIKITFRQIKTIHDSLNIKHWIFSETQPHPALSDNQPIELTTEWLVEFGFKKVSRSFTNRHLITETFQRENFRFDFDRNGKAYFGPHGHVQARYVHELQYEYYMNTGQYLQFKSVNIDDVINMAKSYSYPSTGDLVGRSTSSVFINDPVRPDIRYKVDYVFCHYKGAEIIVQPENEMPQGYKAANVPLLYLRYDSDQEKLYKYLGSL